MNYRVQLSPISGIPDSQTSSPTRARLQGQVASWKDAEFFRSWLVYDSGIESHRTRGFNWNAALGLGLAVLVSATSWAAVGVLISRFVN